MRSCSTSASLIAWSSALPSVPASISPRANLARCRNSAVGRSRLPICSARNGGLTWDNMFLRLGGRVALIGDAAHAMLQAMAQGACQAIEDSLTIEDCIYQEGEDYQSAFRKYESRRLLRATRVQYMPRYMWELIHIYGAMQRGRSPTPPIASKLRRRNEPTRSGGQPWGLIPPKKGPTTGSPFHGIPKLQ